MPDTLTDADIAKLPPDTLTDADMANQHGQASGWLDSVERFGKGWYNKSLRPLVDTAAAAGHAVANPVQTVKDVASSQAVQHPIDTALKTAKDAYERHGQMLQDAKASLAKGDLDDAVQRGTNALIPVLGPQIQSAADKIKAGDVAGGTGELSGLLTSVLAAAPGAPEKALAALGEAASAAKTAGGVLKAGGVAGGADIAAGAGKMAAGAAIPAAAAYVPGGEAVKVAAEMASGRTAWNLGKTGFKQAATGVRNAADAMKAKIAEAGTANQAVKRLEDAFDPATAKPTDFQLSAPINPEPNVAGPQVVEPPQARRLPDVGRPEPLQRPQRGPVMAPGTTGLGITPGPAGEMQPLLAGPQARRLSDAARPEPTPISGPVTLPYQQALKPQIADRLAEGDQMTLPNGQNLTLQRVPLDQIEPDPGNAVNQSKVDEYKQNGWSVAPILQAGEETPYRVFDGHHRITAAAQSGQSDVLAWTPQPKSGVEPTTIPFSKENPPAEVFADKARAAKAPAEQKMAEAMNQGGLTSADLAKMDDKDWDKLAGSLGITKPTVGARGRIAFNLGQLERAAPQVSPQLLERLKSTRSLSIAQQLQQRMANP